MENLREQLTDEIQYCANQYDALKGADALDILTEWSVFRSPDYDKMFALMNGKAIFDGRNVYNVQEMKDLGFEYFSIGRP